MKGKGYAAVSLDPVQAQGINKIFKLAGIKTLPASKYHVTICYDEDDPVINVPDKSNKHYTAKIVGVERLGKPGSKWEAIALILESESLTKRNKELLDLGFKSKYKKYKCHMSIVYQPTSTDFDLIELIYKLDVLPKTLKFSNEHWGRTK